jgi:hypothetical protein
LLGSYTTRKAAIDHALSALGTWTLLLLVLKPWE